MPYRVKSFGEVDSCKSRPRSGLGFVKLIQSGLRKKDEEFDGKGNENRLGGEREWN